MSVLSGVEADIVARVATVTYLTSVNGGTVRGVSDIETALHLSRVPPPAVIVEYAGESPAPGREGPLNMGDGTNQAKHYMRTTWDLFLVSQNFGGRYDDSQTGRTDDADTGQKGVMTLVDDVYAKLAGYTLPSVSSGSKTFWSGAKRYSIQDGVLIYVARVYADLLRTN